jgi:hypothetical protein
MTRQVPLSKLHPGRSWSLQAATLGRRSAPLCRLFRVTHEQRTHQTSKSHAPAHTARLRSVFKQSAGLKSTLRCPSGTSEGLPRAQRAHCGRQGGDEDQFPQELKVKNTIAAICDRLVGPRKVTFAAGVNSTRTLHLTASLPRLNNIHFSRACQPHMAVTMATWLPK